MKMFIRRKGLTPDMAKVDWRWRLEAWFWFLTSITVAIITPHMAQLWVTHHWAHVESPVITFTVRNWIEIYAVAAVMTFVGYEIWHWRSLHGERAEVPPIIERIVDMIANKAGVDVPLVIYKPNERLRVATSSSFISGSRIYWSGRYDFFTEEEIVAVISHEMAHIKMNDTRVSLVKHLILGGMRILAIMQFIVMLAGLTIVFLDLFPWWIGSFVLVSPICYAVVKRSEDAILLGLMAALLLWVRDLSPEVTAAMVFAFTTSFVGTVLTVLASHAFSRVIEYRADAVAIDIAGNEYTDDLCAALDKFYDKILNTKKKKKLHQRMWDILLSHPRVADRHISLWLRYTQAKGMKFLKLA